jgi:hypothetical protein
MIKILEKLIHNRLKEDKELIHSRQYGFIPKKNTHIHIEKALITGLKAKNQRKIYANYLFIDFSKAFDSIDHKLLSEKIERKM